MTEQSFQYEWLVLALVYNHKYYDDLHNLAFPNDPSYITMETQRNQLFKALKDSNNDDRLRMIIIENKLSFVNQNDAVFVMEEVTGYEKINTPEGTSWQPLPLAEITEPETMTDGTQLGSFLQNITSQYGARRHIIITFGHGAVLGINLATRTSSLQNGATDEKEVAKALTVTASAKPLFKKYSQLHFHDKSLSDKVCERVRNHYDEKRNLHSPSVTVQDFTRVMKMAAKLVILTNQELSIAIDKALPQKKLDILVMYNCLMQNIYLQYDLSQCVEYLVAPMSGISHPGYNYTGVFNDLSADLEKPTNETARLFVDLLRQEGSAFYTQNKDIVEGTWKICCTRLDGEAYVSIQSHFKALIQEMIRLNREGPDMFIYLNMVLRQCFNYTLYCINNDQKMIDLLVFSTYLAEHAGKPGSPIKSIAALATQLADVLKTLESCSFLSRSFFKVEGAFADKKYKTDHGFGFLLQTELYPEMTVQRDALSDLDKDFFPSFLQNTGFDEFYRAYSVFN